VSTASEQLRALGSDDEVVVALARQAGRLEAMRAAETLVGAPRGLGPAGLREAAATLRAGPGAGLEASEAFLVAGAAELARQVAHTTADTSTRAWASGRAARLSRVLAEADAITVEPERRTARARAADLAARVIDEALPHLGGADPPDGRPPVVPPGDDSDRGSSGGAGGGTLLTRARVTPPDTPPDTPPVSPDDRATAPAAAVQGAVGVQAAPSTTLAGITPDASVPAVEAAVGAPAPAPAVILTAPVAAVVVPAPARVARPETALTLAAEPALDVPGTEPVPGTRLRELFGVREPVGGELGGEAAAPAPAPVWSAGGPAVRLPGR
jgi:hypothetical protein